MGVSSNCGGELATALLVSTTKTSLTVYRIQVVDSSYQPTPCSSPSLQQLGSSCKLVNCFTHTGSPSKLETQLSFCKFNSAIREKIFFFRFFYIENVALYICYVYNLKNFVKKKAFLNTLCISQIYIN